MLNLRKKEDKHNYPSYTFVCKDQDNPYILSIIVLSDISKQIKILTTYFSFHSHVQTNKKSNCMMVKFSVGLFNGANLRFYIVQVR